MTNNNQLIDIVATQAGLPDLNSPLKTTEYVRARAVAVKLLKESGISCNETARLLRRDSKTIRHARDTWEHIWEKDVTAMRLYRACQTALAD